MRNLRGLKHHIGLGFAIGAVCFTMLWLTAILLPEYEDKIFTAYDVFTPYPLIGWLVRSSDESGILLVLGSWAIVTMSCGGLIGMGIYFLRQRMRQEHRTSAKERSRAIRQP